MQIHSDAAAFWCALHVVWFAVEERLSANRARRPTSIQVALVFIFLNTSTGGIMAGIVWAC